MRRVTIQTVLFTSMVVSSMLLCSCEKKKADQAPEPEAKPGQNVTEVLPDIFNPDVTPEERQDIKPVSGGELRIRIPTDSDTLNPITEDDAQANEMLSYIFDGLISRDYETFEYLPWMAKYWEIRDLVIMEDGTRYEGIIISEDADQVVFSEGTGRITLARFECPEIDLESGTVVSKWGETYKGKIKTHQYSIEVEEDPKQDPLVLRKDNLATYSVEIGDQKEERPAVKKNVVFVFHLRDGITWHDGEPVSVEDIEFGFETVMNEKVDCAPLRSYYRDIEQFKVLDRDTVKFVYTRPYFLAFSFCGSVPILPKHIYEPEKFEGDPDGFGEYFNYHERNRNPLGNSCYVFKEWKKGEKIVFEKNPDYWASKVAFPYWPKEQPYLDRITWIVINNPLAAIKELQNGNIDADFDIEPNIWFTEITNTEEFKKHFVRAKNLTPIYTYIGWNQAMPYFKDKLVRQAMTHLIPRERILRDIHNGLGEVVTGPFFINGPIYDNSINPYEYNPKTGKRLLRKAGWLDHDGDGILDKDGVPFEFEYLIHNAREYHQKIADIVKESLEQAGIKVDIRKIDWTIFGKTVQDRQFDAVRLAWGLGQGQIEGDPFQTWHSSQSVGRGSNYIGFDNRQADELIEKGREELDSEKRWAIFRQLHRILHEEQPYTFMFAFETLAFYNKKFRNVKLYVPLPSHVFYEWYIHPEN